MIILKLVLPMFFLAGLVACGSGEESPAANDQLMAKSAYGLATLEGPVIGAKVTLLDAQGALLAEGVTSQNGAFNIPAAPGLADFTVLVSGGVSGGKPMAGTLSATVRNRPAHGGYTPVNGATTLVTRLLQSGAVDHAPAEASVKKFLKIPDGHNLGHHLTDRHFSHQAFSDAAAAHGGVDPLIEKLHSELVVGGTRAFKQADLQTILKDGAQEDPETAVASLIAKQIASSIFTAIGKKVEGSDFVVSIIGSTSTASDNAPVLAALAAQRLVLQQISNQILALSDQINTVKVELVSAILSNQYNLLEQTSLRNLIAANSHVDADMYYLAANPSDIATSVVLQGFIKQKFIDEPVMDTWNIAMLGVSSSNGLIQVWNQLVGSRNPDVLNEQNSVAIQANWDFLDGEQARTMRFIVDYKTADSSKRPNDPAVYTPAKIVSDILRWKELREKQMKQVLGNSRRIDSFNYAGLDATGAIGPLEQKTSFPAPLPKRTVIDKRSRWMWTLDGYVVWKDEWSGGHYTANDARDNYWRILDEKKADIISKTGLNSWVQPTRAIIPASSDYSNNLKALELMGISSIPRVVLADLPRYPSNPDFTTIDYQQDYCSPWLAQRLILPMFSNQVGFVNEMAPWDLGLQGQTQLNCMAIVQDYAVSVNVHTGAVTRYRLGVFAGRQSKGWDYRIHFVSDEPNRRPYWH